MEIGMAYAVTYFYNVYGPGERPANQYGTVIETFRQQFLAGTPLTVVAPGTQKRNFTHVDDIVDGLVLVGAGGEGDDFGLGDEKEFSILEIVNLFGRDVEMLPERPGNRMSSSINTRKAAALGWKVQKHVTEYIRDIISA
jgi:UDP-glucose 4-epimerase